MLKKTAKGFDVSTVEINAKNYQLVYGDSCLAIVGENKIDWFYLNTMKLKGETFIKSTEGIFLDNKFLFKDDEGAMQIIDSTTKNIIGNLENFNNTPNGKTLRSLNNK